MKELFQFRCTKLKCGVIWAFVVMSAPGPRHGCHLGSAACRVPCWRAFARRAESGRVAVRLQLSLVLGVFCTVGWCSRRGLGDSTRNINTNWKTCEIQVERFWECSQHLYLFFYNCFVFFSNPASTLLFIDTKMSFFVQIKMLWHCILQL